MKDIPFEHTHTALTATEIKTTVIAEGGHFGHITVPKGTPFRKLDGRCGPFSDKWVLSDLSSLTNEDRRCYFEIYSIQVEEEQLTDIHPRNVISSTAPSRVSIATPVVAVVAKDLESTLRAAIAWGMKYGPHLNGEVWDEMREKMVNHFVGELVPTLEELVEHRDDEVTQDNAPGM